MYRDPDVNMLGMTFLLMIAYTLGATFKLVWPVYHGLDVSDVIFDVFAGGNAGIGLFLAGIMLYMEYQR